LTVREVRRKSRRQFERLSLDHDPLKILLVALDARKAPVGFYKQQGEDRIVKPTRHHRGTASFGHPRILKKISAPLSPDKNPDPGQCQHCNP
jgi:hypothetical protein